MPTDIYTTQRKLNEILGIGGIEPSITNDYLNEAHEHPIHWGMLQFDRTGHPGHWLGKKFSDEHIKNLSIAHKGWKYPPGRVGHNKGKKLLMVDGRRTYV